MEPVPYHKRDGIPEKQICDLQCFQAFLKSDWMWSKFGQICHKQTLPSFSMFVFGHTDAKTLPLTDFCGGSEKLEKVCHPKKAKRQSNGFSHTK